jgi:pyruvate formate lyase activating enzyme
MMKCPICERGCALADGSAGACGLYENKGGELSERFPDRYLVTCPISIETMPILHYYPGGKFLQISTAGCNFDCPGCISALIVKEIDAGSKALRHLTPDEVIAAALKEECIGIAFLMNEPIASLPTFIRVARRARKSGLLVGCSSNAYFTEAALEGLINDLDFINIGFKSISDYRHAYCGGATAAPVLRNLRSIYRHGVHVEISVMYRRGKDAEVKRLAYQVAAISPQIPFQVMRYIPLEDADITAEPTLKEAETLCAQLQTVLDYVYLFNSPGTAWLHTVCPNCGARLIKRDFYGPMGAKLLDVKTDEDGGCCCGFTIPLRGAAANVDYRETGFEGGYPFTRGLEMIEAILITIGVTDRKRLVQIWEDILSGEGLNRLHHRIQDPWGYLDLIREYGGRAGREAQAEKLVEYMESKLNEIAAFVTTATERPRVYYGMGHPLFCLKGERLENQLVEIAGGIPVNKALEVTGRPGMRIEAEQLNALNPEVIFISSFIGNPIADFCNQCRDSGIDVAALRNGRVYAHPAPGWDFGSPRWILGLMNIANLLHPEVFRFDPVAEANWFYSEFYKTGFCLTEVNRPFAKPSSKWRFLAKVSG